MVDIMRTDEPQAIEPDPPAAAPSLRGDMIRGSLWMVATRWVMRSIGLVGTIVLARLLVPEDFGLIAMAMLVVGLLDILTSFGVDLALIRNADAQRKHFDTAWTIQVMQGVMVAVALVAAAPFAAGYYDEPRIVPVMQILALGVAAQGFNNIGVVAFRRDLNFVREFWFMVIKRLISFVVTVAVALIWRNYWALVTGVIAGQTLGVVLSYAMHPYRPRFSLEAIGEVWSFSQWMLAINIGDYLYSKADEFIVAGVAGSKHLGVYTMASDISNMPTTELVFPISRALFPGYAKLAAEPQRFVYAYLNVLSFVALFATGVGVGIAVVAHDLTVVVLGPKWLDAVPIIQWLALFGVIRAIYGQSGNVLTALGRVRSLSMLMWLQLLFLIPLAAWAAVAIGIVGVAMVKVSIALLFALILFYALTRVLPISAMEIGDCLWRPALAGLAMVLAVTGLHAGPETGSAISLARDVVVGAVTYSVAILLLWHLAGRPRGGEQFVLEVAGQRFKWMRKQWA